MTKKTKPESVPDASAHFDAIIGLRHVEHESGDATLDVQMSVPSNPPDLSNPAVFMAHWMAQNWELLAKIAASAYAKSMEEAKNVVHEVHIAPAPGKKIVSASGKPIKSTQGA